jgi:hypothetical protein
MRITATGLVGIGTGGPLYALDVRNPGLGYSQIHVASTDTDAGGYILSTIDSQLYLSGGSGWNGAIGWIAKTTTASLVGLQNGSISFYCDTGLTAGSAYTPTTRMSITSSATTISNPTTINNSLRMSLDANALLTTIGNAQFAISGASNANKNLWMGFDTSNNVGVIQPGISGTSWNNLYLNPVGGFVCIGTTATPNVLLSFGQTTGDKIALYDGGAGNNFGFGIQSSLLQIHTGSASARVGIGYGASGSFTEILSVTGGARVGVNTTTPGCSLAVWGTGTAPPPSNSDDGTGALLVTTNNGYGGEVRLGGPWAKGFHASMKSLPTDGSNNQIGDLGFYNRRVTTDNALTEVMRLTSSGNVGIGTSTPAVSLHVLGQIAANPAASPYCFRAIYGTYGVIQYNDGGTNFYFMLTNANDQWGAYNGLRPFYINMSNGAVTMGNSAAVSGGLTVSGQINNSGRFLQTNASETYSFSMRYSASYNPSYLGVSPEGDLIWYNPSVVEVARFVVGGGLVVGTPSHIAGYAVLATSGSTANTSGGWVVYSSDIRTKKNIRSYMRGLAEVLQMEPIEYEYNGEGGTQPIAGQTYRGLSAQELQKFLPEAVLSRRDKIDGEETDVLTIDMAPIPWVLINAIKELTARLAILEAKLGVN